MNDIQIPRLQPGPPLGVLNALHDYWRSKRNGYAVPARVDLKPADFRYALGDVSLIDVLREPLRFRFRVAASNIEARFQRCLTGTYIHDLPEPRKARMWDKVYRRVLETGAPQSFVGIVAEQGGEHLYRAVIWPLASNHWDIDMLLCCRERIDSAGPWVADTPESWRGSDDIPQNTARPAWLA